MNRITTIVFALSLNACAVESAPADCKATSTCPVAASMCVLPGTGGFGVPCDGSTTKQASWVWVNTSNVGEVSQRCNVAQCPKGSACVVQSDVSGENSGGELLFGTCQ